MGVIALLIESGENRITNENDVSNSAMVRPYYFLFHYKVTKI